MHFGTWQHKSPSAHDQHMNEIQINFLSKSTDTLIKYYTSKSTLLFSHFRMKSYECFYFFFFIYWTSTKLHEFRGTCYVNTRTSSGHDSKGQMILKIVTLVVFMVKNDLVKV